MASRLIRRDENGIEFTTLFFDGNGVQTRNSEDAKYCIHLEGGHCVHCGGDKFAFGPNKAEYCYICNVRFDEEAYTRKMIDPEEAEIYKQKEQERIIKQYLLTKEVFIKNNAININPNNSAS